MKISVLVPTYHRTPDLERCLTALCRQNRLPDEVLVVVRDTDTETAQFLAAFDAAPLKLRAVPVEQVGQVAALNAGIDAASGDIISITDDDAAPRPDWLARIEEHFQSDGRVGGVGGRDWVSEKGRIEDGQRQTVGRVQWFGRVIGNHHLGVGPAREVEILKGANMSYRHEAIRSIRFDTRLLGEGAQVNNDMAFSLNVHDAGWKLIYDPAVSVDHYIAPRSGTDNIHRGSFSAEALERIIYNETLILSEHLPWGRRGAFMVWAYLIGTGEAPGLLQLVRLAASRSAHIRQRHAATVRARRAGLGAGRRKKAAGQRL